ncbi:MAG: hypothetical protein AAF587_24045 [Bacteroidota bacterium]
MKLRLLILGLAASLCMQAVAQNGIDVTKLTADTKTFIFDNNKNTVKGYIYAELEERTTCCGSDRIYLEVKIDPSGYVVKVNPLTGKNDCLKRSAADIVKNVKWDASSFKAPKSIYFEIKPEVDCDAGKDNTYAKLEVYNNALLNEEGMQVAGTGSVVRNNTTLQESTPKEGINPPPTETKTQEPVASAETAQESTTPKEETTTPTEEASTPPAENVAVAPSETPTLTPPTYPQGNQSKDQAIEDARLRADADRIAQESEIQALKDQMAQLRAQAEKQREDAKRRAEAEEERLARNEEIQEQRSRRGRKSRGVKNRDDDGGVGGLFLTEDDGSGEEEYASEDGEPGEPNPNRSDEDRVREEISRLEQQLREMEDGVRAREDEERRIADEAEREKMEMFRLVEQIAMKEEEAAQARERDELRRMEEDRMRVEDERRQQEEEYQRMMDEIKRLQDEADQKIANLENQRRDIDQLNELKKEREQKIALEQALREQETQRMLEEKRLYLLGQGNGGTTSRGLTANGSEGMDVSAVLSTLDFSQDVDSEKLKTLVETINFLQGELNRVNSRLAHLEGGGDPNDPLGTVTSPNTTTRGLSSNPTDPPAIRPQIPSNLKTADKDDTWKNMKIGELIDPNSDLKKSDYVAEKPKPTPPPVVNTPNPINNPQPNVQSQNPAQASSEPKNSGHKDTYWDGPGPQFDARIYVEGEAKMKELIKERLRSGGVCGLGQAAFSLTLDPQGNVLKHSILAANSPMVEMQMGSILPGLKFNSVDSRYRQTIYLQFKAEILCEGTEKVNIQNVDNIIKD